MKSLTKSLVALFLCSIAVNAYPVSSMFSSLEAGLTGLFSKSFAAVTDPPLVETYPATGLAGTSAMLNGGANPNGSDSVAWFRYSTTDPGACNDTFGMRAPGGVGGGWELSGTDLLPYSIEIYNLSPGTTYYYCAIAQNAFGTGFGPVRSFTTTGGAPLVGTYPASGLTTTTAILNGGNPTGVESIGWFRYSTTSPGTCNDTFGTRAPFVDGTGMQLYGSDPVPYLIPVEGLAPGTTYYYCAIAHNSVGTGFGQVESFTTLGTAPIVGTGGVLNLTTTSAMLEGTANPTGVESIGWFRYSTTSPGTCNDTFGTRAPFVDGGMQLYGSDPVPYFIPVEGLTPATTYYYCAIAQNSVGTGFGTVQSFTTLGSAPSVGAGTVMDLTTTSALLNGVANPNGVDSIGWFRYSTTSPGTCNDTFGTRAPFANGGMQLYGTDPVPYFIPVEGLAPGTTYYYCAIAQNSVGTGFGPVQSFTTLAVPTVQFASASFLDDESQTMQILVTRTGDTSGVSTVDYATTTGSATAGTCGSGGDYVAQPGTLQFSAAETEMWVPVTLCSDSLTENAENFGVALSSPVGATLGGQSTATVSINDTAAQFRDSNPIQLFGPTAVPYPAQITVAGGPTGIGKIRVTLYDLVYSNPEDIDVLLVGPGGQKFILMADTGGANALNSPTTLTFTDSAGQVLPDALPFATGAYEPTSWGPQETVFASPAPPLPYNEPGNAVSGNPSLLGIFGTTNSNGTWSLYVRSDGGGGFGELGASSGFAGGWGLELLPPAVATASISGRVVDTNGTGINNATITVEGGGLPAPIKVKSSGSGNYVVSALPTGRTYLVSASAKHYTFVSKFVPVYSNITGLDFVGTR